MKALLDNPWMPAVIVGINVGVSTRDISLAIAAIVAILALMDRIR